MASDMSAVIVPKSDQLNSDDLISGPRTIKITKVSVRPGTEQPVAIHFDGDDGKPYKPCKSMCRVMVNIWGADSSTYAGKSMTIYRDPKVKWGGMEVGGIRISRMTGMENPVVMALTETRASRKPFTVKPLVEEKAKPAPRAEPTPKAEPKSDPPWDVEAWAVEANQHVDAETDTVMLKAWWESEDIVAHRQVLHKSKPGLYKALKDNVDAKLAVAA